MENPEYYGPADFSIGATLEGINQGIDPSWESSHFFFFSSYAVFFCSPLKCLAIGLS